MSIRIDRGLCIGCKRCTEVCPGTLISMLDGRANMDYPKDCWGCVSCVKECPVSAINFFLGADIGGSGAYMNVTEKEGLLSWNITKADGSTKQILINPKDSNKY